MSDLKKKLVLNFNRDIAKQRIQERLKELKITLPSHKDKKLDKDKKFNGNKKGKPTPKHGKKNTVPRGAGLLKMKDLTKYVQKTYPLCFTVPMSPLSLNIFKELKAKNDLMQDGKLLSSRQIFLFLYLYTGQKSYRESIVLGAERKSLDGSVSGQVNEKEAMHAKQVLAEYTSASTNNVSASRSILSRNPVILNRKKR